MGVVYRFTALVLTLTVERVTLTDVQGGGVVRQAEPLYVLDRDTSTPILTVTYVQMDYYLDKHGF